MLEQRGSERRTARQDYVDAILCLDAANAADDVRSIPSKGPQSRVSRLWVTTYFVAAFSLSAIGLFDAFR